MKLYRHIIAFALIAALLSPSCKKNAPTGSMTVYMTDAPAAYNKINIDVREAKVHYEDEKNGTNGWITLSAKTGIYNLLDLRNNVTMLLADGTDLPPGKINQLRLVLGDKNTVETESGSYVLKIPSSYSSGLKIDINSQIESSNHLQVVLDFDAGRSVTQKGNMDYEMNPVIKIKSIDYN